MLAPSKSELLRRLREETQPQHLEAEARVRILDSTADEQTYRHYLRKMHGFHAPLEDAFALRGDLEAAGFEAPLRRKAPLLRKDLEALEGAQARSLPRCAQLPDVSTLPRALGCAYVLEGSTLGGQYILRSLGGTLPRLRGKATSFLECYGTQTGPMWKRFGAVITQALQTGSEQDQAVASACETFRCLTEWLEQP